MSESQSQKMYQQLRQKLRDGSVSPEARPSYGAIGKEIGVSATPVRDTVGQLASEGFIELVPLLGAVVRELTREEAVELYKIREALETFAIRRAAESPDARLLHELELNLLASADLVAKVRKSGKAAAARSIAKPFHALDLAFHMTLLEAAGNKRMLKLVGDSHILARIFQADRHAFRLDILETTLAEHKAIAAAVQSLNSDAAAEAISLRIRNSLTLTLAESLPNWE